MHPYVRGILVEDRIRELTQEADSWRSAREAEAGAVVPLPAGYASGVTLRLDRSGDEASLNRLATLNARRLVLGSHVVAEVDGEIVGALPVEGGVPLFDPFVLSVHLVPLLELRAAQIRKADVRRPQRRLRLLPRFSSGRG